MTIKEWSRLSPPQNETALLESYGNHYDYTDDEDDSSESDEHEDGDVDKEEGAEAG